VTHRLDVAAEVYVATGDFTDVIRTDEPFPVAIPVTAITRRPATG
jgi:hypothetical protein